MFGIPGVGSMELMIAAIVGLFVFRRNLFHAIRSLADFWDT